MGNERLSPKVRKAIEQEMALGKYRSQEVLLLEALSALADRREAIAGIERGLADMKAGRYLTRAAFSRELRKRHPAIAQSRIKFDHPAVRT